MAGGTSSPESEPVPVSASGSEPVPVLASESEPVAVGGQGVTLDQRLGSPVKSKPSQKRVTTFEKQ